MIKKMLFWFLLLIVLIFIMSGCMNLSIQKDVDYPESLFQQKIKKFESLGDASRGNPDKASRLNFLLYDGKDRELISFWVLIQTARENLDEMDIEEDLKATKYSLKLSGFKLKNFKDLDRFGPGLIAEIHDYQENSHVLIWLD